MLNDDVRSYGSSIKQKDYTRAIKVHSRTMDHIYWDEKSVYKPIMMCWFE